MKNLEKELLIAKWTRTFGDNSDYRMGCEESIKFCIKKQEEGWMLEDFKADLIETLDKYSNFYGPYKDGVVQTLKYNISQLEVATNE